MSQKGDPHYPLRPECANVDEPMRKPVVKLGKMITDRVPIKLGMKKITKDDPEYWAVARLCTDEEAELALKFGGIRKPKTFKELKKLGIEISSTENEVIVKESNISNIEELYGHNDHRIVMALAILASSSEKEIVIDGVEAINKSYPKFFEDLEKIGVNVYDI